MPRSSPNDPPTQVESPVDDTAETGENPTSATPVVPSPDDALHPLRTSALGSGLLARQPTPEPEAIAAVAKVCPQCGTEYETGSRFCIKDGSPLRPKAGSDPLVGRVIADRYLILARLGEGGMGRVYLAEHVKMNRQCAVKVMNPSLVNDHESVTRFAREASSAARILHPNVATVFDFGESDRIVYLVMEYVDGESLSQILARDGRLEPRRAVDIARQIADGLSAAHELGIVHRDLKPDNVIVTQARNGRDVAKIVDFGIAKAVSEKAQDALTRSGLVIGTPEYMSPEQLLGDPVDARSDVYSLGSILFQMLTGTSAFADDTREQMIRRRLHEVAPHVRDLMPELPRRLDTVIAHMLARSAADRLATAAEARDALDPALVLAEWAPSAATIRRSLPPVERTRMMAAPSPDPGLQPTMPITRQTMSWRRIGIMSSVGSAALLGGLVVWANMRNPEPGKQVAALPQVETPAPAPVVPDTQPPTQSAPQTPVTKPQDKRSQSANGKLANSGPANRQPAGAATHPVASDTPTTAPKQDTFTKPTPPVLTPDQRAVQRALDLYAQAFKTGSVESVKSLYHGMPDKMRDQWREFFGQVTAIVPTAVFGPTIVADDTARVDFTLILDYKSSTSSGPTRMPYSAMLVRHEGTWEIVTLTDKSGSPKD